MPLSRTREAPIRARGLGRDVDAGRILASILDGVADKILQQRDQGAAFHPDLRKTIVGDGRAAGLDGSREREQHFGERAFGGGGLGGKRLRSAGGRILQQVVNERTHSLHSVDDKGDELSRLRICLDRRSG